MDYLVSATTITKLRLSIDMLSRLQLCINKFSIRQWKMDCLIPYGLSPVHASKFNQYFAKYFVYHDDVFKNRLQRHGNIITILLEQTLGFTL